MGPINIREVVIMVVLAARSRCLIEIWSAVIIFDLSICGLWEQDDG